MAKERKYSLTLDNSTRASTPTDIAFKPQVWMRHHPLPTILFAVLGGAAVFAAFTVSAAYWVPVGVWAFAVCYYWIRCRELFTADSNAGLVISEHPTRIVVHTNLAKFGGRYPAFKVIECRTLKQLRKGDRVATVSTYTGLSESQPYWDDFHPLPLHYATDDDAVIEAELSRYPESQWAVLESFASDHEPPRAPGLYPYVIAKSDWRP